jgi:hypothetical protein
MMTLCVCLSITTLAGFIGWKVERKLRRRAEMDAGRYVAELSQTQQERELYRAHAQRDEGILELLYRGGRRQYQLFCDSYREHRRMA